MLRSSQIMIKFAAICNVEFAKMTNNTIKHLGIVENIQGSHLSVRIRSDVGLCGL